MFKKILFHALIGGVFFIIGASLHDFAEIRGPGNFLAYAGMLYAGIATVLILLGVNLPSIIKDSANKKARKELLEYKKLLDVGALTKEEFESKASELKKKIL